MPSCVVKGCKISSDKFSKEKGVTFHLFPKLMTWQWKWIHVIRKCRNQRKWLPSPVSVVCSVHFADSDIYTAKGGNRRIKRGAVPSINLYESINIAPNEPKRNPTDKNVSVAIQTNAVSSVHTDIIPHDKMTINDLESSRNCDEGMEQFIIKVEPIEDEETDEIDTQNNDIDEYLIIKEEPNADAINTPINLWTNQQNAPDCSNAAADSTNYENKLNVAKTQLNKYKKKVHLLHEKLKRSRKMGLKMKNILKEIKFRNLIDRDMFKRLTAVLFENDD